MLRFEPSASVRIKKSSCLEGVEAIIDVKASWEYFSMTHFSKGLNENFVQLRYFVIFESRPS